MDRSQTGGSAGGATLPPPAGATDRETSWAVRDRGALALPLIIAHRGASALEPENSLEAFGRARADGADGVELDVLLCATGQVVVFHDDDLIRLGGRHDRIAALSLNDLRGVRLLSGAPIPTLEEAFEACGDALLINVELKASGISAGQLRALIEAVAAVIRRAGPQVVERVLVSSFNPRAVYQWRRRVPGVRAGLLFERSAALPLRRAWAAPWVAPYALHPESVLCTAEAVRSWHHRGYRVNVWTVDQPAELTRFAAMGVDGIITNDPARSRQALRPQPGNGRP